LGLQRSVQFVELFLLILTPSFLNNMNIFNIIIYTNMSHT
jgi:hypothetical protein